MTAARAIEPTTYVDLLAAAFSADGDVKDAVDAFARGWITSSELRDRMEYLRDSVKTQLNKEILRRELARSDR